MLHGVKINGTDLFTTYGLILLADLKIEDPKRKTDYIDIPGADGSLDLSDEPQGRPVFQDRNISFTLFKGVDDVSLEAIRSALLTNYHGKKVSLVLPSDDSHHFDGVIELGGLSGYNSGKIPVKMRAAPYRLKNTITTVTKAINRTGTITLTNEGKPVTPKFSTNAAISVSWTKDGQSHTVSLPSGNNQYITSLQLDAGSLTLSISGSATVSVEYLEGRL